MNARDKELADEAEAYADRDFKGEINWSEAYESKLIALIRADEREACAKVCDDEAKDHERKTYDARDGRYDWQADGANACASRIRARGNK